MTLDALSNGRNRAPFYAHFYCRQVPPGKTKTNKVNRHEFNSGRRNHQDTGRRRRPEVSRRVLERPKQVLNGY